MTAQFWIVLALLLLIGAASVALVLDGRQTRMDRHVEAALSTSVSASAPSIRRPKLAAKGLLLHRLANYKAGIPQAIHPLYILLAGAIAAMAVFYLNSLFEYPLLYATVAAFIVALMVVRGLFGSQRHRFVNQLFRQMPDTIGLVTSAVRSGLPIGEAFRSIAREMPEPTAGQFAIIINELNLGRPIEEAMEDVYRRTEVAEYGFFAVTLAVQMKAGGSLCDTLQTLADTVRQRVGMADRAKAMAGEVIFSSRALSVSPVVIGAMLYMVSPQMVDLLFTDPTGRKLLAYAGCSVLTGSLVMRWMVRRGTTL
ncbi:type II secretion system F family protein [uncultured Rhodoblastus sp.]|uniref:type II secretion system F family protein n=1 Tax=uncultured Rhodoblastus sp. TaxID=543037 RepID=UPI0025F03AA3|nr:type II secretion system F family protein [uncultured Rhodoblastus sp.]